MSRLQSELDRLYRPLLQPRSEVGAQPAGLVDASGRVRCMVMELRHPPNWEVLSRVWQGVQAELELPAPAIAVSGTEGLQLWFSLAEPVPVAQAHAFLAGLQRRFLADIDARRVVLMPTADASALHPERHATLVPALQEQTGNWSAFLAQDLAPIFADTPWLDVPPNEEGQATLLRSIAVAKPQVFLEACDKLAMGSPLQPSNAPAAAAATVAVDPGPGPGHQSPAAVPADGDPKRFLAQVMNDGTVPMALRIEAAKALLQHATR